MYSIMQAVADVLSKGTGFHAVEALGFSGFGLILWRFTVKVTEKIEALRGNVRALDVSIKGHVDNTPTLATCATHVADVQRTVAEKTQTLREEVAVLMLEHGHDVRVLEERVTRLAVKEGVRTGRNGVK